MRPARSTVAASLAASFAHRGHDTVLVDADTYGGSIAQMLAMLDDVSGLMAACRAANQGRADEVTDHLLDVEPRLRLLSGIPRADMWPQVRPGALELVLQRLRADADVVVADCASSLEPGEGGRGRGTQPGDAARAVNRPTPCSSWVAPIRSASPGWSARCTTLSDVVDAEPMLVVNLDASVARLVRARGRRARSPVSPASSR